MDALPAVLLLLGGLVVIGLAGWERLLRRDAAIPTHGGSEPIVSTLAALGTA